MLSKGRHWLRSDRAGMATWWHMDGYEVMIGLDFGYFPGIEFRAVRD